MNPTWKNGKNLVFGPDFGLFGPNLGPKIFLGFTFISSYTLFQAIILCSLKEK